MIELSEVKIKFNNDTSVRSHGYTRARVGADLFYEVTYYDTCGEFQHIQLPVESFTEQDLYEDFTRYKNMLKDRIKMLQTEATLGKCNMEEYSKGGKYILGDAFLLNGLICTVTGVIPDRDYFITFYSYERDITFSTLCSKNSKWKVQVHKEFKNFRGNCEETYYLLQHEIPVRGDYSGVMAWYDALMKVVNKE